MLILQYGTLVLPGIDGMTMANKTTKNKFRDLKLFLTK